jgi:ribosome-associated protein
VAFFHSLDETEAALRKRISEGDLCFTFSRAGGPGGQNVNKVNTRVTLWFDVAGSPSLTREEKATLAARLRTRLARDGRLHVSASRFRTQAANRRAAVERFFQLLAEALARKPDRRPTRMSRAAHERRLHAKRERSESKDLRRRSRGQAWD